MVDLLSYQYFHEFSSSSLQKNIGTSLSNSGLKDSSREITTGMPSSRFPPVRELVSGEGSSTRSPMLTMNNDLFRRFAEVEALAVLTLIVSTYKIEVTEEPQHATQTFEQRKERILKGTTTGLSLMADGVSVTFRRRSL